MKKRENTEAMVERMALVATLYYKEKLSQQEIARRLDISRPWVSKLLARAEEMGIVTIEIHSPVSGNSSLEAELCKQYGLHHAGVVGEDGSGKDYAAMAAVHHFVSVIQPKDVVGVGWGNGVSRFVRQLVPMNLPDTKVVPLAGSFGTTFETLPNYNAIELAGKLGGKACVLHVPAFCSTKEEYNALMRNPQTQTVLSMGEQADIAVVGIGTLDTSYLTQNEILSPEEIEQLRKADTVGDVILQFRNRTGQVVETDVTKRMIRADISKIRDHARTVLALATGEEKVPMLDLILSLGLVDAFFTDEKTALKLIRKKEE